MKAAAEFRARAYVENHADRLTQILRDLVRIPSENRAPFGAEGACQEYVAAFLRDQGCTPTVYIPDAAPGITAHPLFWPGRDYTGRPNVMARVKGEGGGQSLVLSGHVDTVPIGSKRWTREPFGGEIEGNKLFGRGSNDMKAGIAASLFVLEALRSLNIQLRGDLMIETVVDEEFGGANGTLAGRLMGFNADAAILTEPTSLRVCPAQRGGRTAHIRFGAPNTGILGPRLPSAVEQLRVFLNAASDFAESRRRSAGRHPYYQHLDNPVPANVTRIQTAPWGVSEPPNVPPECLVEFFWEAMPGETQADIDREFNSWLDALVQAHPSLFTTRPEVVFPIRWLPGSALPPGEPLIQELSRCAAELRGSPPPIQGIEGPCDLFVFHEFGIPAVLWGARGGNTHNPDEYVEIDSLVDTAVVLLAFVCRWCGVSRSV
jgi:acetylornithine deacetylase